MCYVKSLFPSAARPTSAAIVLLILLANFLPRPTLAASELVMFEEPGCAWCERWREEIGIFYDKTEEAKRLPLRQVNLHDERPVGLERIRGIRYTPTFVVMNEGKEVGRILGYAGEDFFWWQLDELIVKMKAGDAPRPQPE